LDTGSSTFDTGPLPSQRQVKPPVRYGEWYYAFSAMAGTLPLVPKTYQEAIDSPLAEQWHQAIDEEFDNLIMNQMWKLTSLPPRQKAIKCKWMYALKIKSDCSLEHFKARLVAKGYS
jgi:enamine deaminase RidA (YjgF/YER057c/UK114 family)